MLEQKRVVGLGLGLGVGDSLAHRRGRLGLDLRLELVPEHPEPAQVALVPAEALVAMVGGAAGEANAEPNVWRAVMSWRVVLRYWE